MEYVYLDTEFNRKDFTKRGTISVALVTPYASYYAVNAEADVRGIARHPEIGSWMSEHVLSKLPNHGVERLDHLSEDVKDWKTIGVEVSAFLRGAYSEYDEEYEYLTVIANCGAQDMVRLHSLTCDQNFAAKPDWVPAHFDDIKRWKTRAYRLGLDKSELPQQDPDTAHHPLHDAEHEMDVHRYLLDRFGEL